MFIQTWGEIFTLSFQNLWLGFVSFAPSLILAIIIFIIGWIVGTTLSRWIQKLVNMLRVDQALASTGVHEAFNRAGLSLSLGRIVGELVRWFIIIVFLMTSLEILNLAQVNDFLRNVVLGYLPQVIIAAFILVFAAVIADFVSKVVVGSARAARVPSVSFLGAVARYAIWVFAIIFALAELGVAREFMQILFSGIIAMLAIAGGLAFGLGGKDAASRTIEKLRDEIGRRN